MYYETTYFTEYTALYSCVDDNDLDTDMYLVVVSIFGF